MKLNPKKTLIILLLFIFASLFVANFALAKYKIEISIPGGPITKTPVALTEYIRYIYLFGIALVGVAALVYLTIGGLIYMLSDTIGSKDKAKEFIWGAISGLILALAAYLILNTINPKLIELNEPKLPDSTMNIEQTKQII